MFSITVNRYTVSCIHNGLPALYRQYRDHAALAEEIGVKDQASEGDGICFMAVAREGGAWPFIVVAQRYSPASEGFGPGAALILETDLLFIGAGERVLCYDLKSPRRLFEDTAEFGFWGWARHGDSVVMAAELEMAVWDIHGRKLWSRFVEPPWTYEVRGQTVLLDVMGSVASFPLEAGPGGAASGIIRPE